MTDTQKPVSPEQIEAIRERWFGDMPEEAGRRSQAEVDIANLIQALEERDEKIALLEDLTQVQASALECAEHNSEVRRRRIAELEGKEIRRKTIHRLVNRPEEKGPIEP